MYNNIKYHKDEKKKKCLHIHIRFLPYIISINIIRTPGVVVAVFTGHSV